ncbi:MAG TPA: DUF4132 domain-containing protein [Herpetosiphonaceae bacterium]
MHATYTAIDHLQDLLGPTAIDDAVWEAIRAFEQAALPIIEEQWPAAAREGQYYWAVLNPNTEAKRLEHFQRRDAAAAALDAALGAERAAQCAAVLITHPQLWQPAYASGRYNASSASYVLQGLLDTVAERCLERRQPPEWPTLLAQRALAVCAIPASAEAPDLHDCLGRLANADPALCDPLFDALVARDWDGAWEFLTSLAGYEYPRRADRLGELWLGRGSQHAARLVRRLHERGLLDAARFRQLLEHVPGSLGDVNGLLSRWDRIPPTEAEDIALAATLQRLLDEVLWEMLCDFRPETWPTLSQIHFLSGGKLFLRLVEEIEQQGLTFVRAHWGHKRIEDVLGRLAQVIRRRPDDDAAELTRLLAAFRPETLLAVLPSVTAYRAELCAALAWPGADELLALLDRISQDSPDRNADPTKGVVHRAEIMNIVQRMDAAQLEALLNTFAPHQAAAAAFVRAAQGVNRKEIRRLFGRRNQLAARAFGLLPLESPEELMQRYLKLATFYREANSSAAGRKAYERAAAQAGLANLALQAGFADATRLEWAMQDRLGAETLAVGRSWEIEGYALSLALDAGGPRLEVRNGERLLKRTPAAVTREFEYREVRATVDQAKEQERRYKLAFAEAMRRDQPLSPEELDLLCRNPLAVNLLERLVLVDEAGACGLLRAGERALEGTHGELVRITGSARIAHAYGLAREGLLADWQTEIVRRGIVQPFRQIFRELYILTPAEITAQYSSARLAGRGLKGRQASAFLANLGWLINGSEVRKPFYDLGFEARFNTGAYDWYGYGDDDATATTGLLEFWPLVWQRDREEQRVPLDKIPPLALSEVLRDLDMVTVIAHQSDEHGTSREVLTQRADLVRALINALGLRQARVEEPYVHVEGSLTSYRIHLATAAIYLSSGQYLCIVPSAKQQKSLYLPFDEGRESVGSEVISKLLLLINDAAISDQTIRRQIVADPR